MMMKVCAISMGVVALLCAHLAFADVVVERPNISIVKLKPMTRSVEVVLNRAHTYHDLASTGMILTESFGQVRGSAGFRCPSYAYLFKLFHEGFDQWSQVMLENLAIVTEREHALFVRRYESSKPLAHQDMMSAISQLEMNYLSDDAPTTLRGNPLECWYDLIDCLKRGAASNHSTSDNLFEFLSEPDRANRIAQYEKENFGDDDNNDDDANNGHGNNAASPSRLVCPTEARTRNNHQIPTNVGSELPAEGTVKELIRHWEEGRPWLEGVQVQPQVDVESVLEDTKDVNIITLVSRFETMAKSAKDSNERKAYLYKLGLDHLLSLDHIRTQLEAEKEEQRQAEDESSQLDAASSVDPEVSQRMRKQMVQREVQQRQAEWADIKARAKAARERAQYAQRRVEHLERVIKEREAAERKRDEEELKANIEASKKTVSRISADRLRHLDRSKNVIKTLTNAELQRRVDESKVRETILYIADRFKKFDTGNDKRANPISVDILRDWTEAWGRLEQWDVDRNHVAMSQTMLFLYSDSKKQILNARIKTNLRNIGRVEEHIAQLDAASRQESKRSLRELRSMIEDIRALLGCIDIAVDTRKFTRKLKQLELRPKEWSTMAQFIEDDGHWAKPF